jgi:hypothetical protein
MGCLTYVVAVGFLDHLQLLTQQRAHGFRALAQLLLNQHPKGFLRNGTAERIATKRGP